jgi:hypothetical protein
MSATPILSDYFTRREFAAEMHCRERTIDRWHSLGIGPPRTLIGGRVFYLKASVAKWLAEREARPTAAQ